MLHLYLGLHDLEFQNKSDVAAATWHGFTDIVSGIERYFWCVGTNKMDQTCDVLPLKNVGIQTSVSSMLPKHLHNGKHVLPCNFWFNHLSYFEHSTTHA